MRINLIVPYSEHELAKKRGAKWDMARKTWYVENAEDLSIFFQWAPEKFAKITTGPLKHPPFKVVQPRTPRKKNWGTK
jgi:hypothetical protein